MKLIHIKSTITPKDYSIVRNILKKERGEKLAPFIHKLHNLDHLEKYLSKENINYEIFNQEEKLQSKSKLKERLIAGYQVGAKSKQLVKEDEIWEEANADGLE